MEPYDILVLGGGPAGITLAKNLGKQTRMAVLRPEDHSMIYCAMPYAIEDLLPLEKTLKRDTLVTDAGAELVRDKAVKVDFSEKKVVTEKNGSLRYKKLVIATGADPIVPPIPGSTLKGVFTFKTEEDMRAIMGAVDSGLEQAVVVGAGAIGVELAQALVKKGVAVKLVDMTPQVLPNLMDYEMVEEAEEELIKSGVEVYLHTKVTALQGSQFVEEIELEKGKVIHFDGMEHCSVDDNGSGKMTGMVVFAVGMRPNVEMFTDTGLEIERDGIVVNEKMETNIPGVYAVGDCVQYISGITGSPTGGKLATNAVPMARVVANNLAGMSRSYPGFYNGAATKIGGIYLGGTGLSEVKAKEHYDVVTGYAEFTTAFPVMPFAKKVRMKLIADRKTGKLLGGQVTSGEPVTDKVDQITMAVQYGIPVRDLLGFSYSAQPYQSFFPAHNLLVKAAEEIVAKLESAAAV